MYFVYILQSKRTKTLYTGMTNNLKRRIADHNNGRSTYTCKFRPWKLVWYCAFPEKDMAERFERYLKKDAGSAFLRKRLVELKV